MSDREINEKEEGVRGATRAERDQELIHVVSESTDPGPLSAARRAALQSKLAAQARPALWSSVLKPALALAAAVAVLWWFGFRGGVSGIDEESHAPVVAEEALETPSDSQVVDGGEEEATGDGLLLAAFYGDGFYEDEEFEVTSATDYLPSEYSALAQAFDIPVNEGGDSSW